MVELLDSVRAALAGDLKRAMKARDVVRIAALRAALGALDNATAVPQTEMSAALPGGPTEVARRVVSRAEIETLLLSEAQERAAAAIVYRRLAEPERAERLRAQAHVIRDCLRHLGEP